MRHTVLPGFVAAALVAASCTTSSTETPAATATISPVLRSAELMSRHCWLVSAPAGVCSVSILFDNGQVTMSFETKSHLYDKTIEAALTEEGAAQLSRIGTQILDADLGGTSGVIELDAPLTRVHVDDGAGQLISHLYGAEPERGVSLMRRVHDRLRAFVHHLAFCRTDPWVKAVPRPCERLPNARSGKIP